MFKRRPNCRPTNRDRAQTRPNSRRLQHERLERRELLAAEILAIRPDSAGLLQEGATAGQSVGIPEIRECHGVESWEAGSDGT